MNPERWERIKQLYHSALEEESGRRREFLQEACAGDESLRSEVESMLAHQAESPDFLESPALQAEAKALARDYEDDLSRHRPSASPSYRGQRLRHSFRHAAGPWWVYLLAAVFAADCVLRSYCFFLGPHGFDFTWRQQGGRSVITHVPAGSAADRAGLKPGDVLLAADGQTILRGSDWRTTHSNLETGRAYHFDIERDGLRQTATYPMQRVNLAKRQVMAIWQMDAILLLATSFLIAFARPHDFLARVGALALAALSSSLGPWASFPPGYAAIWRNLPRGLSDLLWIPNACSWVVGPILLTFFTLFPRALFRARWPWVFLWLPALCFVPIFLVSNFFVVYRPLQAFGRLPSSDVYIAGTRLFGLYGLASLAALALNYRRLTDLNDRRRLRLLLLGGGAAVLPGGLRLLIWRSASFSAIFNWLASGAPDALLAVIFAVFPVSFAYSILRHRLLDIRVIIRQGLRYALARGALLSVVPVLGVILVIDLLAHGDQPLIEILEIRGWAYAALGMAALAAHTQRHRWVESIDRRFFREQYDARRLLLEVAAETGRARGFAQAAPGIVQRIEVALHPEFVAILERKSGDSAFRSLTAIPPEKAPDPIPAGCSLISVLRILNEPIEVLLGESVWLQGQLPLQEIEFLRRERIDMVVPIGLTFDGHEALIVLGMKRSEEPFTREDSEMLSVIAANLELLLARPDGPASSLREQFEECPQCGSCYPVGTATCLKEHAALARVYMPRTLAERYHLERRLGRGGMGAVYEATDGALERRVAVKVIREDRLISEEPLQRFQGEARAAAAFTHPNVVTVYDYGVEAGARAFLVMELLQGTTLRDELRAQKRLSASRTIQIFRGVCSAVEAAHDLHIIHRDLKPENIFLARTGDGGGEVLKVLDFGIAKFLPAGEDVPALQTDGDTEAGVLVGTPGYISPEQLLGERPSVSWDLWALAVTVYETLTGSLPFPAASSGKWRLAVLAGAHAPLHEYLALPPEPWEEFFARTLAPDRAMRPRSAVEFFRHLEQALA